MTHRILSIGRGPHGERVYRTKGDNNASADLRPFTLNEPRQARVAFAIPSSAGSSSCSQCRRRGSS